MRSVSHKLDALPEKWLWVKLNEIGELIRGVSYSKGEASSSPDENRLPILRAHNIEREINLHKLVYVPKQRISSEQRILKDDIVIAMSSGSKHLVGKAAQSDRNYDAGFGAFCGVIRLSREINRKFVGYYFQSPRYKEIISASSSGVNINNLRREHIELLDLPFPPSSEQERIVSKLEELLTQLDAGVAELRQAYAQLKRYRQAVLKAAVSGELTREWREMHADAIEPASQLLMQILDERRVKWERNQLSNFKLLDNTPQNDGWKKKYSEPSPTDISRLPDLPQGWTWASLDQLLSLLRNGIATKPTAQFGIPILRISSLRPMSVNLIDRRFLPGEYGPVDEYVLHEGDLLFTRYNGNRSLVGVCGVVPNLNELIVYPDKLIRGQVASDLVLPRFLQIVLSEGESREFIAKRARTTAGQTGISGGDLRMVPIPLAPFAEQEAIVEKVERCLSIVESTEADLSRSLREGDRIRQSILKKAFEGKLVAQDPNDEPAESLLERIKTERAMQEAEKQTEPKSHQKRVTKNRSKRTERPAA